MGGFVKAAKAGEVAEGTGKTVDINGRSVALFNVKGRYYALENTCPHMGGPLGEGTLEDKEVTCPWHAWPFDVTTGECIMNPDTKVEAFNTKQEGEDILVNISEQKVSEER